MAKSGRPKLNTLQLRNAYKKDLADAWTTARRRHARNTPYAFVLWGLEGGEPPRFMPCVLTEEDLSRVAQRYVDGGYHDTLDEARNALRYSVADAARVTDHEQSTPT